MPGFALGAQRMRWASPARRQPTLLLLLPLRLLGCPPPTQPQLLMPALHLADWQQTALERGMGWGSWSRLWLR